MILPPRVLLARILGAPDGVPVGLLPSKGDLATERKKSHMQNGILERD
jgi:hypothetical protein